MAEAESVPENEVPVTSGGGSDKPNPEPKQFVWDQTFLVEGDKKTVKQDNCKTQ